jgi:hypothetical protein
MRTSLYAPADQAELSEAIGHLRATRKRLESRGMPVVSIDARIDDYLSQWAFLRDVASLPVVVFRQPPKDGRG